VVRMKGINTIGKLHHIFDAVSHVSAVFPADTNLTWTLTAHEDTNTWSAWAEIADSAATKLSASFTTTDGHVTSILIETISETNTIYLLELAWGADKTVFAQFRFAGGTRFQAPQTTTRFWAPHFPKNELLYYRMKTATAVADTCTASLRYHGH